MKNLDEAVMPKIEFKAWHTGLKKMFSCEEMVEDQLTLLTDGRFINVSGTDTRLSKIDNNGIIIPILFTGFADKENKKIYAGDIIPFTDGLPYVVVFGEYQHQLDGVHSDTFYGWWLRLWRGSKDKCYEEGYPLQQCFCDDIKVAGNIFENREILEKVEP